MPSRQYGRLGRVPHDHFFPLWWGGWIAFVYVWGRWGPRGGMYGVGEGLAWLLWGACWAGAVYAWLRPPDVRWQSRSSLGKAFIWLARFGLLGVVPWFLISWWSNDLPKTLALLAAMTALVWCFRLSPWIVVTSRGIWQLSLMAQFVSFDEMTGFETSGKTLDIYSQRGYFFRFHLPSIAAREEAQALLLQLSDGLKASQQDAKETDEPKETAGPGETAEASAKGDTIAACEDGAGKEENSEDEGAEQAASEDKAAEQKISEDEAVVQEVSEDEAVVQEASEDEGVEVSSDWAERAALFRGVGVEPWRPLAPRWWSRALQRSLVTLWVLFWLWLVQPVVGQGTAGLSATSVFMGILGCIACLFLGALPPRWWPPRGATQIWWERDTARSLFLWCVLPVSGFVALCCLWELGVFFWALKGPLPSARWLMVKLFFLDAALLCVFDPSSALGWVALTPSHLLARSRGWVEQLPLSSIVSIRSTPLGLLFQRTQDRRALLPWNTQQEEIMQACHETIEQ